MIRTKLFSLIFVASSSLIALGNASSAYANDHVLQTVTSESSVDEEWAIALSGGGLRSSLFMIGALKALDEHDLVSSAPAISSVSGGSYANYWLYSHYASSNPGDKPFGYYSFSEDRFSGRVCDIATKGNFVTIPQIARNWLIRNSIGIYQNAIVRTYGSGDPIENGLQLSSFAEASAAGEIPVPYINATISQPREIQGNDVILTFSPDGVSNANLGEGTWGEISENDFPMYRMIAISGASVGALKQWMPNPFTQSTEDSLRVWDGGRSENLGAFTLIAGGRPKVLIIDAEHDPNYTFGAYDILKSRLATAGIALSIDAIEEAKGERLETSFFVGQASGEVGTTEVVYIKMGLPGSLDGVFAEQAGPDSSGANDQARFMEALENSDRDSDRWDCGSLDYAPANLSDWFAYNTASYAEYLNGSDGTAEMFNSTGFDFLRLDFPHYSTADQSFYVDQSLAYIGLGYLQMSEFLEQGGE